MSRSGALCASPTLASAQKGSCSGVTKRGAISAIDVRRCALAWRFEGGVRGHAVHDSDNEIVVGLQHGTLTVLDASTGERRFEVDIGSHGKHVALYLEGIIVVSADVRLGRTDVTLLGRESGERLATCLDGWHIQRGNREDRGDPRSRHGEGASHPPRSPRHVHTLDALAPAARAAIACALSLSSTCLSRG